MTTNYLRGFGPRAQIIERAFVDGLAQQIEHRHPTIERRRGLSADELRVEYREKRRPVIIEGALNAWPATTKWTFEYLTGVCGDTPVVIDHYSPELATKTTFAEFVEQLGTNVGPAARPLYLQEWHFLRTCPALADDIGPLETAAYDFFPRLYGEGFSVRALWIGQRGAVTRLHQDAFAADVVHGQIHGRKQWILFGPGTVVPTTNDEEPSFGALFEDPKPEILHGICAPGDVIYVPTGWWHRVSIVEDSISVGMQTLDEQNLFQHMMGRLQELLPLILNPEHIKENYPVYYQASMQRLLVQAKRFGIDLTRIR